MKYRYATLDVFTDRRFAGNPLAVVFDADAIDGAAMQAVAREFNYPETVFVLKPEVSAHTAKVRIFTPALELAFAGHPTVGTALVLALARGGSDITLEAKIGLLKCKVDAAGPDRGRAQFGLPELPTRGGAPAERAALAAALNLRPDDIGLDSLTPARWSVGNHFTFVPVRNIDAVRRANINDGAWDAAFEVNGRSFAFVFCRETVDKQNHFHARMFAPRVGVREDPATGSAAAALSGYCADVLKLSDGEHRIMIEQGYEMGRPSLIELRVIMRGGNLADARIGGPAIVVAEGKIEV